MRVKATGTKRLVDLDTVPASLSMVLDSPVRVAVSPVAEPNPVPAGVASVDPEPIEFQESAAPPL